VLCVSHHFVLVSLDLEFFLLESFVWVSPGPACILSLLGSWSEFVDRAAAGFRRSVLLSSVHRFHSRSFGFLHALGGSMSYF
jgi:hypothetical protein